MTTTKVSLNLRLYVQYVIRYWNSSESFTKTIIGNADDVQVLVQAATRPFSGVADVRVWELDVSDLKPVIL